MPSIHIGTFNIFQSRAPHAVRDLIKKHDLAVVALQEVDVNAERSARLHVPEVIADGTYSYFSRSVTFGKQGAPMIPPTGRASDKEFGVAFVSKFPIKSSASVALGSSEAEYWKDALDFEREPTYPIRVGNIPRWQIDHIFFRNFDTSTITIGPMRTCCDPAISDHALCMISLTQ